ncbi:MAG TPA: ABC transporter permease subunit/CPBP intramembrane protease [Gemmataceae bacterium]|nr:ABC transporter permease subunit/CPBP intramembrane protease [Gemmataceae bacterium]
MRWTVVQLIFCRELRDQLRDRRTIFMIVMLPLLLYPLFGAAAVQFAVGLGEKPTVIGVAGSQYLPPLTPKSGGFSPLPVLARMAIAPADSFGLSLGMDRLLGAAALAHAASRNYDYPPLLVDGRFPGVYFGTPGGTQAVRVKLLESEDRTPLEDKEVDLILRVPPDFRSRLEDGGRPALQLITRPGDEVSRQASRRLRSVLARWKLIVREVRFLRLGLPANFDDPFSMQDSEPAKPLDEVASDGLLDLLVRIFPFLLVMWSLAGALYPAVDLCAGEKERGTMETLLISPASREELVSGKFLTIWLLSAATAFLNLASMGITSAQFNSLLPHDVLRPAAIFWCVLLILPLSAFFSAISLAVGAYARSSKEGQYYLMPLFLITTPLIAVTFAPGVELNGLFSLIPVTGVALLMQRLMTAPLEKVPWLYFVPVLVPMALYSWLALRWAIEQFKREEVLFREAERLEIKLWLRRLFREKEALPSSGQALFCFALIIALRWIPYIGDGGSLMIRTGISYLAFVATPPLFMALLLTTRPRQGLALRLPSPKALLVAALLAALLLPPLIQLTSTILCTFPRLQELLSESQPFVQELRTLRDGQGALWWMYLLVYVLLPAVCEELAFRGFILSGLRRHYSVWTAIVISSFLFALYHRNVFQAVPTFTLGVVLGILAVRSGSVIPGMLFHLVYNGMLIGVPLLGRFGYTDESLALQTFFHPAMAAAFALLACTVLMALGQRLSRCDSVRDP